MPSSTSRLIAQNTLVQLLGKAASTFFGILTTVALTRYLAPTGYGTYFYLLNLSLILTGFSDWGTVLISVRELSRSPTKASRIFSSALLLRSFIALFVALFALLVIRFPFFKNTLPSSLSFYLPLLILLFNLKATFSIVFQARLKMQFWALSETAAGLLIFLLSLWGAFHRQSLSFFLLSVLFGQLLALLLAVFFTRKLLPFRFQPDRQTLRSLFKASLPMGATLVLFTVYNKLDTVFLGIFKGQASVGVYAVAYRIHEVLTQPAAYLLNSTLPLLSAVFAQNNLERLRSLFQKTFALLLLMALPLLTLIFLFAPLIVQLIAGSQFTPAASVLRLLLLATFVSYFNHLTGYTLVATQKQHLSFYIALVAFLVNLAANLTLVPLFSYYGAALVTFLTELTVQLLTLFILYRSFRLLPSLAQLSPTFRQLRLQLLKFFSRQR